MAGESVALHIQQKTLLLHLSVYKESSQANHQNRRKKGEEGGGGGEGPREPQKWFRLSQAVDIAVAMVTSPMNEKKQQYQLSHD